MDALLAEQLSAVSGNFVFCENEIELFENLLYLAVVKN
jgi:L-lactate dehydrogenase complex protein LldG